MCCLCIEKDTAAAGHRLRKTVPPFHMAAGSEQEEEDLVEHSEAIGRPGPAQSLGDGQSQPGWQLTGPSEERRPMQPAQASHRQAGSRRWGDSPVLPSTGHLPARQPPHAPWSRPTSLQRRPVTQPDAGDSQILTVSHVLLQGSHQAASQAAAAVHL